MGSALFSFVLHLPAKRQRVIWLLAHPSSHCVEVVLPLQWDALASCSVLKMATKLAEIAVEAHARTARDGQEGLVNVRNLKDDLLGNCTDQRS